jgi:hypothetical protein
MKATRSSIARVVEAVLELQCRKAFIVLSPDMVVTAARRYKVRRNERSTTVVLTIGKPNYAVRQFIHACKRAGEPLPIRKIQLEWYKDSWRTEVVKL